MGGDLIMYMVFVGGFSLLALLQCNRYFDNVVHRSHDQMARVKVCLISGWVVGVHKEKS